MSRRLAPLTEAEARHLLRRAGFGARLADVRRFTGLPAAEAAQILVQEASSAAPLPEPAWVGTLPPPESASDAEFEAYFELNEQWLLDGLGPQIAVSMAEGGLRQRLTLAWHNHFVTSFESYGLAEFGWRNWNLLERHALGNFRTLVNEVGLDPAMLIYLDGALNENEAPNENYARELMELFTMGARDASGQANYTENDVAELARALTGWTVDWDTLEVVYEPELHDAGTKTILGRTGTFDYAGAVDLLFQERPREIARFVADKLYRDVVFEVPNPVVVQELSALLQASEWDIRPVLETLLSSEHFFSPDLIGARIKDPITLMAGFVSEFGLVMDDELAPELYWVPVELDQWILSPPNVAGWPGQRAWIDTTTLPGRWEVTGYLAYHGEEEHDDLVVALATELADVNDPLAAFRLPLELTRHLLPVSPEELSVDDGGHAFGGNLAQFPIPPEVLQWSAPEQALVRRFLAGLPWYEWTPHRQEAPYVMRDFVAYLTRLPEFQLT